MSEETEVYYFSNGTEGRMWMANWCDRCVSDHCTHNADPAYEDGCFHICEMMSHMPSEALIASTNDHETWACLDFQRCSCDGGPDDPPGEEPPPPIDPNQIQMFDTDGLMPGVPRGVWLDELTPALPDKEAPQ